VCSHATARVVPAPLELTIASLDLAAAV